MYDYPNRLSTSPSNMRIALGTVQFGQPYGIANKGGQVSPAEAEAIVTTASACGVDTLDTAMSYGASEQRLGDIGVKKWRVVTKLPAVPEGCRDVAAWVCDSVAASLSRLRVGCLHAVLLHRSLQLLESEGDEVYRTLAALKEQGTISKLGVSVYGPDELDALWPRFRLDLVQSPYNVIDRRLDTSGWLKRLKDSGTEIHVRSIFLQGLLLMDASQRPAAFDRWRELWEEWRSWLRTLPLTPLQACVAFALSRREIDRVVVGVDSLSQLKQILDAEHTAAILAPPDTLMSQDLDLVNPSRWKSS